MDSNKSEQMTVQITEPTQADIQPFLDQGFNIDFSDRVKITATKSTGKSR